MLFPNNRNYPVFHKKNVTIDQNPNYVVLNCSDKVKDLAQWNKKALTQIGLSVDFLKRPLYRLERT